MILVLAWGSFTRLVFNVNKMLSEKSKTDNEEPLTTAVDLINCSVGNTYVTVALMEANYVTRRKITHYNTKKR